MMHEGDLIMPVWEIKEGRGQKTNKHHHLSFSCIELELNVFFIGLPIVVEDLEKVRVGVCNRVGMQFEELPEI